MVLSTKQFKDVCSTILSAIDTSELSTLKETLELITEGTTLYLNVTNKEYYASVKFTLQHEEQFHATVNASQFLKLVATTTSETIELTVRDTYLAMKANGNYKLPFVYEGDHLLQLPAIEIENPTVSMQVSGDTLNSILQINSKEIAKVSVAQPVQKLYYIDELGCITFTTGACVNNFTLPQPVKVLVNNRLVRLFKLFKNEQVQFTLGYDALVIGDNEETIQTKVKFETDVISLTAITPSDDAMLAKVPVQRIRALASKQYDSSVVINKEEMLQAINRLALFDDKDLLQITFSRDGSQVTVAAGENKETLTTEAGGNPPQSEYQLLVRLTSVKNVLETCTEQLVTIGYGDHTAIVLSRGMVQNVIPESYLNQ